MFDPSRDEVRRFFFDIWKRYREAHRLTGIEAIALDVILKHPEYQGVLDRPERYLERDYPAEHGETNPFLHMSMHLALSEQLSIDQPAGIRAQYQRLLIKLGGCHEAEHAVIDCLAEMIWRAQRVSGSPDAAVYFACLSAK